MKVFYLLIVLAFLVPAAKAQHVSLIKPDALSERIRNGGDTAFVINFWATWCGPCVKELPYFEKLSSAHKNDKLKVLLVSVDFRSQYDSKVLPFVRKRKFRNEVFLLDEKDQQAYINKIDSGWSGAIPATLFVSNKKRNFSEKEFTYTELETEYLKIKQ